VQNHSGNFPKPAIRQEMVKINRRMTAQQDKADIGAMPVFGRSPSIAGRLNAVPPDKWRNSNFVPTDISGTRQKFYQYSTNRHLDR